MLFHVLETELENNQAAVSTGFVYYAHFCRFCGRRYVEVTGETNCEEVRGAIAGLREGVGYYFWLMMESPNGDRSSCSAKDAAN